VSTAIIGTGGIGSAIARRLASGGEPLRLSSADHESARGLAAELGEAAVVAVDNRDAMQGADGVVLALRFTVLKGVSTRSPIRSPTSSSSFRATRLASTQKAKSHVSSRRGDLPAR
jgi:pyrroline-5-carboxylate reductase